MTKIFAVMNHKGGVGKTTSTVNIGAALALNNFKVLLIDLDSQANLTHHVGIKDPEYTIYDYLKGEREITTIEIKKNLFAIPSTLDLAAAEIEISSEPGREYILKEVLGRINEKFDFIIIDCPPSLGILTINALTVANKILVPLQAEFLPLKGLAKITEVVQKIKARLNPDLKIGGVFFTQYDQRKIMNRDIYEAVKTMFGEKLLNSTISKNIALAEAPGDGVDIFQYNSVCKGAEDYKKLCSELLNSEEKNG